MLVLKNLNLLLRFLLELCLLGAAFYIGLYLGNGGLLGLILGLVLVAAVTTIWGGYMAPRSGRRLPPSQRIAAELSLFAAAAVGLLFTGQPLAAGLFALGVAINESLLIAWKQ